MASAIEDIAAERRRQIDVEGWGDLHDDEHSNGEMADAAACYIRPERHPDSRVNVPVGWPWASRWWKPKDRRRDLVRAAALIVAEIERLDRAALSAEKE